MIKIGARYRFKKDYRYEEILVIDISNGIIFHITEFESHINALQRYEEKVFLNFYEEM